MHTSDIIKDMERGYSVLMTFGKAGRQLKRNMAITGFICRALLFIIFNPVFLLRARFFPGAWRRRKAVAIWAARLFFPFRTKGYKVTPSPHGQILVINHPTLNDPLCALLYILGLYPDREIILPVNLPWFESICRYRPHMDKIGVKIVPILTPSTAQRLGSGDDVAKMQGKFMTNYISEVTGVLSGGGLAVVAQQATRQRYLFTCPEQAETGEGILATISLMLVNLRRAKLLEQVYVTPVGVIPHRMDAAPKLNLFRRYSLNIGEPILATEVYTVKNAAKRPADLHILLKLKDLLPNEFHFENC